MMPAPASEPSKLSRHCSANKPLVFSVAELEEGKQQQGKVASLSLSSVEVEMDSLTNVPSWREEEIRQLR